VKVSPILLFTLIALEFVSCNTTVQKTEIPPNIVFISIDDLNDWVGFLGHEQAITPHMDQLAAKGFSFTNAHCPAPVCGPSRTAVLSGLSPVSTGVYDNNIKFSKDLPEIVTLPEHFRNNGYQVYGVGKLFHGGATNVPKTAFDSYGGKKGSSAPFTSSNFKIANKIPTTLSPKGVKLLNYP
jgi:arylsulfatase A-like enzyme